MAGCDRGFAFTRKGSVLTVLPRFIGEFKSSCSFSPEAASFEKRTVTRIGPPTEAAGRLHRLHPLTVLVGAGGRGGESDFTHMLAIHLMLLLLNNLNSTILIAK